MPDARGEDKTKSVAGTGDSVALTENYFPFRRVDRALLRYFDFEHFCSFFFLAWTLK